MSTFDRFRRDSASQKNGEELVREEYIDDDNEFDFEFSEQAESNVSIEGAADAAVETPYEIQKMNLTRIGEDTLVTGNIKTKGHIDILGTVKGNIEAEGNIAIRSDINGNIKGNNVGLGSCVVTGNVNATKNILTDADSEINGNIVGHDISIAGQVTGDIKAENIIVFKKEAVLEGNIETDDLVVEPGAIINGKVTISRKPRKIDTKAVKAEKIVEPTPTPAPQPTEPKVEPKEAKKEEEVVVDVDDSDITDI